MLRFAQVCLLIHCIVKLKLLTFANHQAGLLFHTKYYEEIVWEEPEGIVLGMPYFSLGKHKHSLNFCHLL